MRTPSFITIPAGIDAGPRGPFAPIARLCEWISGTAAMTLARVAGSHLRRRVPRRGAHAALPAPSAAGLVLLPDGGAERAMCAANVVGFPTHRRAKLNELARLLHARLAHYGLSAQESEPGDPILLLVKPGAPPRLLIDTTAYIELLSDRPAYRVVLGEGLETCILLETSSFEEAERFALRYLLVSRGKLERAGDGL